MFDIMNEVQYDNIVEVIGYQKRSKEKNTDFEL